MPKGRPREIPGKPFKNNKLFVLWMGLYKGDFWSEGNNFTKLSINCSFAYIHGKKHIKLKKFRYLY